MITGNSARAAVTRHPPAARHIRPAAFNGGAPICGSAITGNDLPIRGR